MRLRSAKTLLPSGVLLSTLMLGSCSWFNDVGEHFPVVGERCEYWQCFTEYGRQQSDLIKQQKENAQQQQASGSGVPSNAKPVNAPGDVPAGAAPATQTPPASHVEFIDPNTVGPVDLSSPPPPLR